MTKGRIYISGPISGLSRPEYTLKFAIAEFWLDDGYWKVINPVRLLPCRWPWLYRLLGYRLTLAYDLFWLRRCTHIAMLQGWERSRGARLEHRVATKLKLKFIML